MGECAPCGSFRTSNAAKDGCELTTLAVIGIGAIPLTVLLLAAGFFARRYNRKLIKRATQKKADQDTIQGALENLKTLRFPANFIRLDRFLNLGRLIPYEEARDKVEDNVGVMTVLYT